MNLTRNGIVIDLFYILCCGIFIVNHFFVFSGHFTERMKVTDPLPLQLLQPVLLPTQDASVHLYNGNWLIATTVVV
ncbi:hypothetical protein XELAEV_18006740mg [Xenopus laevis]|uniref:Uncharacterized protein n=1 Tax=Xenopus laevis TaxID=8355 RepID=A0A974E0N6_XENLA|nr:hypothetical protein XELAEV_18006740mg [Xenopus laevis]